MKLCDLEEVVRLRNYREKMLALSKAAESGYMELHFAGCAEPSGIISLECVRRAVQAECQREIDAFDEQLRGHGVEI